MALFLRQDEQRSRLQEQVAAQMKKRQTEDLDVKADVPEPTILEGQHTTRKAGLVIMVLLILLVAAVVFFALRI